MIYKIKIDELENILHTDLSSLSDRSNSYHLSQIKKLEKEIKKFEADNIGSKFTRVLRRQNKKLNDIEKKN